MGWDIKLSSRLRGLYDFKRKVVPCGCIKRFVLEASQLKDLHTTLALVLVISTTGYCLQWNYVSKTHA